MSDSVNKPSHYAFSSIECIDYLRAIVPSRSFIDHCRMSAISYITRSPHKGNEVEDIDKAINYLQRARNEAEKAIEAAESNCPVMPDSSTWIPKVGDRVWVNCPGRVADGEIGVVIEGDAGRYAVRIDKMELTSFNLEAKQLELIDDAQ